MGAGVRVTTCTNICFVVSSQASLWGSVAQHHHIHVGLFVHLFVFDVLRHSTCRNDFIVYVLIKCIFCKTFDFILPL